MKECIVKQRLMYQLIEMHIMYLNNNTTVWFDLTNVIDYSHLL